MSLLSAVAVPAVSAVIHALMQSVFGGLANLAFRPAMQKLESTGFFNLEAHDIIGQYGEDLVEKSKAGQVQEISGREKEMNLLISALRNKDNPCIIGEAGVGKTALVEGLAYKIAKGDVPDEVKDWTIIKVDFPSLIVGKGYGGSATDGLIRLRALLEYATKNQNVVIFIDEAHQFGAYADLCKTYLDRKQIRLIGATTLREFSMYMGKDPALERRFTKIFVSEPSFEEALAVAKGRTSKLEKAFNVKLSEDVVVANSALTAKYLPYKSSPDREIKNLQAACEIASREADEKLQKSETEQPNAAKKNKSKKAKTSAWKKFKNFFWEDDKKDKKELEAKIQELSRPAVEVTEEHVRKAIDLPITPVTQNDLMSFVAMPYEIKSELVGQDKVVDSVCSSLLRTRLDIGYNKGTGSSFLFAGPSGVGKTRLAELLSEKIDVNTRIVIDASRYDDKTREWIIEKVKDDPHSLIVFDGLEKGKPEIINEIVSFADKGWAYDNTSRRVNFGNAVIILTVNTGDASDEEGIRKALVSKIGAEAVNKIDNVEIFNTLSADDAKIIAKITLNAIQNIAKTRFGVDIKYSDEVMEFMASQGLKVEQGARGIIKYASQCLDKMMGDIMKGAIKPAQTLALKVSNADVEYEISDAQEKPVGQIEEKIESK